MGSPCPHHARGERRRFFEISSTDFSIRAFGGVEGAAQLRSASDSRPAATIEKQRTQAHREKQVRKDFNSRRLLS
jgi:hypothetical protein